jgi:hypothetical protein
MTVVFFVFKKITNYKKYRPQCSPNVLVALMPGANSLVSGEVSP